MRYVHVHDEWEAWRCEPVRNGIGGEGAVGRDCVGSEVRTAVAVTSSRYEMWRGAGLSIIGTYSTVCVDWQGCVRGAQQGVPMHGSTRLHTYGTCWSSDEFTVCSASVVSAAIYQLSKSVSQSPLSNRPSPLPLSNPPLNAKLCHTEGPVPTVCFQLARTSDERSACAQILRSEWVHLFSGQMGLIYPCAGKCWSRN
ncbi:hypothetical protein BU23DRAFT_10039 [Bimuria novae-zelandiae CBS 107.79]|uniref:Uncharacterized protein n=1 Tax=Bimuria novae-zelandiae CBS 107.79 TaxID=1447943 RepID=A0A6A5VVA9_9PLEO|nr:hypothetical protein BU23DRAFT_10039 [Bimuria novae-zelandiae CBS 107.79]